MISISNSDIFEHMFARRCISQIVLRQGLLAEEGLVIFSPVYEGEIY